MSLGIRLQGVDHAVEVVILHKLKTYPPSPRSRLRSRLPSLILFRFDNSFMQQRSKRVIDLVDMQASSKRVAGIGLAPASTYFRQVLESVSELPVLQNAYLM